MQHLHIVLENDAVLLQSFGRVWVWPLNEDHQNVKRSIIFKVYANITTTFFSNDHVQAQSSGQRSSIFLSYPMPHGTRPDSTVSPVSKNWRPSPAGTSISLWRTSLRTTGLDSAGDTMAPSRGPHGPMEILLHIRIGTLVILFQIKKRNWFLYVPQQQKVHWAP